MKTFFLLLAVAALSPFHISMASDDVSQPQFIPHKKLSQQYLRHDRRKQSQVDRQAYRSEQSELEARRELALEMRQLRESNRAPASK